MVSWPFGSAQSGPTYRVSDDVVVHLSRAVDANNAEDHKDHGPRVHQRPHRWLPAACVHAGVEAKGGREAGPGPCRGSHSCTGDGPGPLGPAAASLYARTFLAGHEEEAFGWPVGAGAEQAAGRCHAHAPVEGWLVGLRKVQFPAEAREAGTEARKTWGSLGGAVRHVWPYSGDRPGLSQHRGLVSGWGLGFGGSF